MQPWFWCWPHTNLPSSTYFLWCLSFYFLNCSNFVFSSLFLNFVLELSKYWSIRILNYQHIVKTWLTYAIVVHSIYIFVNPNHNVIIRNIFDKSLYARSQFHIFALNFVDLNYVFFLSYSWGTTSYAFSHYILVLRYFKMHLCIHNK